MSTRKSQRVMSGHVQATSAGAPASTAGAHNNSLQRVNGSGESHRRKGTGGTPMESRRRLVGSASRCAGQNRVAWYEPPNYWHRIIGGELVTSLMSNQEIKAYLASIGSKGGKISRRTLTPEQAKAMVRAREKKRRATKRALRRSNSEIRRGEPDVKCKPVGDSPSPASNG